jgi:phage host-nuclease inhibitor protein Gam
LEGKVKDLENLLEEMNYKLKTAKADLAEAHLRIENQIIQISNHEKQLKRLSTKLEKVNSKVKDVADRYEHEIKELKEKVKTEVEKSSKLTEALRMLRDTCFGFATRFSLCSCEIFNSVRAVSGDANCSVHNIPKVLEFAEK